MKEPLPASLLEAPDCGQKKHLIETIVAQQLALGFQAMANDNYSFISKVYSSFNQMAAAYTRYRFGEMDGDTLKERYGSIFRNGDLQLHTALPAQEMLYQMVQKAEITVDDVIERVYSGTNKYAGKDVDRNVAVAAPQPSRSLTFDELEAVTRQAKKETGLELKRRQKHRQDAEDDESRKLFASLRRYADVYIDYQVGVILPEDAKKNYTDAVHELSGQGIGGHVGNQLLHMCQGIADTNIRKTLGGMIK